MHPYINQYKRLYETEYKNKCASISHYHTTAVAHRALLDVDLVTQNNLLYSLPGVGMRLDIRHPEYHKILTKKSKNKKKTKRSRPKFETFYLDLGNEHNKKTTAAAAKT